MSSHEETIKLPANAKLPPSYDSRVSWFWYAGLVRDWITFTIVDPTKKSPLLKNRLVEDVLIDPENGVEYFLNFLRGYLKDTQNAFLCRFLSFFNHRRGNGECVTFISKLEIHSENCRNCDYHSARDYRDSTAQADFDQFVRGMRQEHSQAFPLPEKVLNLATTLRKMPDYEGEAGFWAEDEDGEEGVDPVDDEEAFWQLGDRDAFGSEKISASDS